MKVKGQPIYRDSENEEGKKGFLTYLPYGYKFQKEVEKEYIRTGVHKPSLIKSSFVHKGTDEVKPFGYKRDIMFGSKGSTGHLKDF